MRFKFWAGFVVLFSSQVAWAEPDDSAHTDVDESEEVDSTSDPDESWDVARPYGPTHDVALDLTEGTWMSLSVHEDTLIFDLLGDIWSMPLSGGEAQRLTEGPAWDSEPRFSPSGDQIAFVSDADGNEQIWLMNADGSEPEKFTNEDNARLTDPVWDPDGEWLLARRRTVDTRSIGVTEIWQYHLEGGSGFNLTELSSHPHAGETVVGEDYLYFSSRYGRFSYDENPVSGLWRVVRLNRTDGQLRTIVHGPGSAVRPWLSPDQKELYFVSRDRSKTLLEVANLETGQRRTIADWLDADQMEGFALHGLYPAFDWVDDSGQELVIWAGGKIWRLNVETGQRTEIPFRVKGNWTFHEVVRPQNQISDTVQAKIIRWPSLHADGRLAFSALGMLWIRQPDGRIERVSESTGFAPAWSPDGKTLAWTRVRDGEPGELLLTKGRKTEVLPIQGQLLNPSWSPDGSQLVVLRGGSGSVSVDLNSAPWFDIVVLTQTRKGWESKVVGSANAWGPRAPRPRIHDDRIWLTRPRWPGNRQPSETTLVSMSMDGKDERVHLSVSGAEEVIPSPDFRRVAYKLDHQVHVAVLPEWGGNEVNITSGAVPARQLTEVVGDWLTWAPDGRTLMWVEGPELKRLLIESLEEPPSEDGAESDDKQEVEPETWTIDLALPRHRPDGNMALTHATVLSMNGDEVIENATVLVEQDRITSVESGAAVPDGFQEVDLTGKTIIPGLIDVHGHMHFSSGDVHPETEWRYQTHLDFGVTTVSDPSAYTDLVFTQAERVEAGFMPGPRVFSTGGVLYGALSNSGAKTPDEESALRHVQRIKMLGGNSVKVYQQSRRDTRQWYVKACNAEQILCVAEGGGDLWMNLGMVMDGFQAIEHALPNAPVYADVQQWMAASATPTSKGVAYTPTLLVAYGGLSGEGWFYQHMSPVDDERLSRHGPRRQLDAKIWRRRLVAHDSDWHHQQTASDAAEMARKGVLVTMGGHGQLQGLGSHWELWALAGLDAPVAAMTPMEALRAATLSGAEYLGLETELGSIEPGKLADLVILNADPREDIRHTTDIYQVMKNGELWDSPTP